MLVLSCRNTSRQNSYVVNTEKNRSKTFIVNNIDVFWDISEAIIENDTFNILQLKNAKTNKILLRDTLDYEEKFLKFEEDYNFSYDFQDANFDGYDDYVTVFHFQNARTNNFKIYTFNPKLKTYEFLLDGDDLEIDTINKTVSSSWFSQIDYIIRTYHFKDGKIDFEEEYNHYIHDSDGLYENIYTKKKDKEVIYIKRDTIKIE